MKVTINDKTFTLHEAATLSEALDTAGIATTGIATAVNGVVIPADMRAETVLAPDDKILIIKAFYGG